MHGMLIADQLSNALLICKWALSPNKEFALRSLGGEIRGLLEFSACNNNPFFFFTFQTVIK